MGQLLIFIVVALVVAAIVFGVTVMVSGGDTGLTPVEPDGKSLPLPGDRPLGEEDVFRTRFDVAFRGYRMAQVDQALQRAAYDIGYKGELIGVLEAEVTALREGRMADADVLRRAREASIAPPPAVDDAATALPAVPSPLAVAAAPAGPPVIPSSPGVADAPARLPVIPPPADKPVPAQAATASAGSAAAPVLAVPASAAPASVDPTSAAPMRADPTAAASGPAVPPSAASGPAASGSAASPSAASGSAASGSAAAKAAASGSAGEEADGRAGGKAEGQAGGKAEGQAGGKAEGKEAARPAADGAPAESR